jgi:hypothetical protein
MTVISKDYNFLNEEKDFYFMNGPIIMDDIEFVLDKRLHIIGDMLIVGGIKSNVDIAVEGSLITYGENSTKSIQASILKMLGRSNIDGDIVTRESAIIASTYISGDAVHNGKLNALSEYRVEGKLGIKGISEFNDNLFVGGDIFVSGVIDPKMNIYANNLIINETNVSKILRFANSKFHLVYIDGGILLNADDYGWKVFNTKEEIEEFVSRDESDFHLRKLCKDVLSNYDCIKNMAGEIHKVG